MNTETTEQPSGGDNPNSLVRPSDSEMLDWLEKQGSKYYGWEVQTERDYPNVKGCVWLKRNIMPRENACLTARDAIANAMSNANAQSHGTASPAGTVDSDVVTGDRI